MDTCVPAPDNGAEAAAFEAAFKLKIEQPHLSAARVLTRGQAAFGLLMGAGLAAALLTYPSHTASGIFLGATLVSAAIALFRAGLTLLGDEEPAGAVNTPAWASVWPVYSVLVPLYREAHMAAPLVKRLGALAYPASQLDILILTEADDLATCEAVRLAIAGDARFRMIAAPAIGPRTKPKALNYGLRFARGAFAAVFDAEDDPEPEQLKKAVLAFARSGPDLVCLQASLNFYNARRNALTRLFALEYAQLFDHVLPGLVRMGAPVPLGGTSNHFRMSALKSCGAWDPFNVTEDADLGVRLARQGYKAGILNSITYEEATFRLGPWYRQRSRWLKGYMQTWLVHMRAPVTLCSGLGLPGFLCFQLFVGGAVFAALVNPWLWAVFLIHLTGLWSGPAAPGTFLSDTWFWLFFVLPNGLLIYSMALSALKRGWHDLIPWAGLGPAYWVLQSAAGYRALWQLIREPFYWDKTDHGAASAASGNANFQIGQALS